MLFKKSILIFSLFLSGNAFAVLSLDFTEVAGNLTLTGGGTLDVNFAAGSNDTMSGFSGNASGFASYHRSGPYSVYFGSAATGDLPIATSVNFGSATSGSGNFGIETSAIGFIYGPESFTSGTAWSGSATWNGVTLNDLGRSHGDFGSFSIDTQVVNWTMTAVPEPKAYTIILGMFSLLLVAARRRRL